MDNGKSVPLLDLVAQYETIREDVRAAVDRVLSAQSFILGPEVEAFEHELAEYSGVRHAIGVTSGTDAILVALMALGVGHGDEVITTPYTFIATATSIARLGARPVFVEIDPETYNLDATRLAAAITSNTRAILPVHLFGQMADMEQIGQVAEAHGISVVEDAAQAIGARRAGLRVGQKSAFATLSFFPSKNLGGAGDGGALLTNDDSLAERARLLRNQGQAPKHYCRVVSGNFRLDALQAAILRVKLRYLSLWTAARVRHAASYCKLFHEMGLLQGAPSTAIIPPVEAPDSQHVYNQFVVRTGQRDALQKFLRESGVGCDVYYPRPIHLQECFAHLGFKEGDFREAEAAALQTLALPVYPELRPEQQQRVVETLVAFRSHHSPA